ncbi:hypothetical protein J6590_060131, partial [Homalodisca vitripennis]
MHHDCEKCAVRMRTNQCIVDLSVDNERQSVVSLLAVLEVVSCSSHVFLRELWNS